MDKDTFIRACREGGHAIERALRVLDRSYYAALYRECRHVMSDAEAARDVVQETFIKVWQRCATFRGNSELLPWMRAIMRRNILDHVRRPEREVPLDGDGSWTEAIEQRMAEISGSDATTPQVAANAYELAETFSRCWEKFEADCPSHAAVITWIVEDGLDNEQIAELLGRTPGATREFVSQCRSRARRYLAPWYDHAFGTT